MRSLSLPFPPSLNSIWRSTRKQKGQYLSPRYKAWKAQAEAELAAAEPVEPILGPYRMTMIVNRPDNRKRDLSNLPKVVEDFLQSAGLIRDDSDCQRLMVMWGSLPPSKDARVLIHLSPAKV